MRDVKRIRMHCILLVFLIVISALAGCSEKQPTEETDSIQIDKSAVYDFSKKKEDALTGTASGKSEKSFISEATKAQSEGTNCIHVQWAEDVLTDLSDYERFRLGLDEEQPLLYFWTDETIKEFKELSLALESADDDGTIRFTVEETYNHGTMTPEAPLLTRMEFIGTIPNNGISYVDSSGNTRYFALEVSGYDGSLLLSEFAPQT